PFVVDPCKGALALAHRAHGNLQLGAFPASYQRWRNDSHRRRDEDLGFVPLFYGRGRSTDLGKRDKGHRQRAIEVNERSLGGAVSKLQESMVIVAGGLAVLTVQVNRNPHVTFLRGAAHPEISAHGLAICLHDVAASEVSRRLAVSLSSPHLL